MFLRKKLELLWPIKRHELKKVLPLILIKFLISLVYCMLTGIKDTIVINADKSGAEVIPVIKSFLVLPISIVVAMVYSKLSSRFSSSSLFYSLISVFIIILGVYAFILYPNKDFFTPVNSSNWALAYLGDNYKHWIAVYTHWIHVLFFVTTELWGQVVIFLLYWVLANNICTVEQAKRTYSILIAAGSMALIISGPIVSFFVKKYYYTGFIFAVKAVIAFSIVCSILTMLVYWILNNILVRDKLLSYKEAVIANEQRSKQRLSLVSSFRHIFSSKYLIAIAVMVLGCAFCINIAEVTWKAQLKNMYPTQQEYQLFMSNFNVILGFVTLFTTLFISGKTLHIGWVTSARVTPLAVFISGLLFFLISYFREWFLPLANAFNIDSLKLVVLFGAFQNLVAKTTKYAFFDSTKEIVFIPLDRESKTKGKAAIDLIGSRLGKSSSSIFQLFIMKLKGTGSVLLITPFIMPCFAIVIFFWYYSVNYLGTQEKAFKTK
jgi:AAA family ATP:ADP antiporter